MGDVKVVYFSGMAGPRIKNILFKGRRYKQIALNKYGLR